MRNFGVFEGSSVSTGAVRRQSVKTTTYVLVLRRAYERREKGRMMNEKQEASLARCGANSTELARA